MSRHNKPVKDDKNKETVPEKMPNLPLMIPESRFNITSRNIGAATFSSMAKQAESLVNGDNSLVFNNYDNKLYFHSNKFQMKDCVNIDMLKKQINNVESVNFGTHGTISGISDGYYVNKSGAITKVSDKNIALSTVFGANLVQQQDTVAKELRMEIERRKYDDNVLTQKLKETSDACEMVVRMVNYINYDTENHSFSINIPFEDSTSENLTFLDLMPSETIEQGPIDSDPGSGISQLDPINSSFVNVLNVDRTGVELNGHLNLNNHCIDEIAINLYNSSDNTIPTTRAITNFLEPMNISITRNTENIAGNSTRIERIQDSMEELFPNNNELGTNVQKLIVNLIYPVGAIYTSFDSTSPAIRFGIGQWEQIVDRFLYCSNSSGEIGGSKKITVENLPEHKHEFTGVNASGQFIVMHTAGRNGNAKGVFSESGEMGAGFSLTSDSDEYKITWDYTPTGTIENTGQGADYMPEYITIYAWKRVA